MGDENSLLALMAQIEKSETLALNGIAYCENNLLA